MPDNNEIDDIIRNSQREAMRQTVAFSASITDHSTLKVLDYILNASTTATAQEDRSRHGHL